MAGITVQTRGLAELRRDLRAVDRSFGPQLGRANQRAAQVVADDAKRRAPKGPHEGGGTVAPISSTITALRRQNAATVAIGGSRSPHAPVTEFGGTIPRAGADKQLITSARRRRVSHAAVGLKVTHVTQQAYLYPAIYAKTGEVVLVYNAALGEVMAKAFGK